MIKYACDINTFFLITILGGIKCTVDMNMSEFKYLANHLHSDECRKLVAGLHFNTYDMPNALDQAERKVSKDVPCLEQLVHWNSENGGGKGETHELVSRRLTEIGREDLARWLTKTSYMAVENDFERMIRDSFKPYSPIHLRTINITTMKTTTVAKDYGKVPRHALKSFEEIAHRRIIKQDIPPAPGADIPADPTEWTIFDTISWTIVILLFMIIVVLMVYLTMASPCCKRRKRRRYDCLDDDDYCMSSPVCMSPPVCNKKKCGNAACPSSFVCSPALPQPPPVYQQPSVYGQGPPTPPNRNYPQQSTSSSSECKGCKDCNCQLHRNQLVSHGRSNSMGMRTIDIHQKIAVPMCGAKSAM